MCTVYQRPSYIFSGTQTGLQVPSNGTACELKWGGFKLIVSQGSL